MIGEVPFDPVVQRALHAAAALLFLSAAAHKLHDPSAFRSVLGVYRVLPERAVPAAASVIVALELVIGVGCVVPGIAGAACVAGAGLLFAYAWAIAANLLRGRRDIDCGCGGPGGRRPLSGALLVRNGALTGLLLLAAWPETDRPLAWLDALTGAALFASAIFLHAGFDVALANDARLRAAGGSAWAMH